MTTHAASGSRARLVALMLFFGLPALLLTTTALNTLQIGDESAMMREKEFQLSALMRRLTAPARDGKPLDLSAIYLSGGSATLASANLQQHLVKSIATASGKLIETSVADLGDGPTEAPDSRVGIRTSFDIDNRGLLTFLHELEAGLPIVFVDRISVRRLADDAGNGAELLRVDLDAVARWKAPGS